MTTKDLLNIALAIGYLQGLSLNEQYVLGQKEPLWSLAEALKGIVEKELKKEK